MASDTKERILEAALEMFSQNGYAGTNIRELSASLGLVKSGVYKHYESKEAIWNALLDQIQGREACSFRAVSAEAGKVFIFAMNVGLRKGELMALKYSDVDFDKKCITIKSNRTVAKKREAGGKARAA